MNEENRPRGERIIGPAIRGRGGSFTVGIVLVLLGVVFILQRRGVIPEDTFYHVWPLIFVFVGLAHLFGPRSPKDRVWGVLLMAFGVLLTLGEFGYRQFRFHQLWPFALMAIGVFVLIAAFIERSTGKFGSTTEVPSDAQLDSVNVFGGGQYRINAKNFRGGKILAVFGGFELDLRQAEIEGQEAVVEVNALFGGGEIKIPETWNLVVSGMGIFGGYGDETRQPASNAALANPKTLVLKGVAIFGGVGIKN